MIARAATTILRRIEGLGSGRAQHVVILFGLLLVLPAIGSQFVFDDNAHALLARGDTSLAGYSPGLHNFFVFSNGNPADVRAMVQEGSLAWWTLPEFKNAFWRPLSAATHWLDARLWPDAAAWMHVHSLAWYFALLLAVAALYRRTLTPPWLAGFALLLFVIDDAHGQTVGWNANRNALVAAFFCALCLRAHVQWRLEGARWSAGVAVMGFAIGLCAGEMALGVLGYLVAYALLADRGSLGSRAISLVPYALVSAGWLAIYRTFGFGSRGSDAYLDPAGETVPFLIALPRRLLLLLTGQVGAPGADAAFFSPPDLHYTLWIAGVVSLGAFAVVIVPVLRARSDLRFWLAGSVLAAVPVCASFTSDRNLLLVGFGTAPVLAALFHHLVRQLAERTRPAWPHLVLGSGFAVLHLVVSPILLPFRARSVEVLGRALERAERSIPQDDSIRRQTLVLANVPLDQFASWLPEMRQRRRAARPAHVYWLSTCLATSTIRRVGPRTLRSEPERGFLYGEPERLFRAARHRFSEGDRVELVGVTAEIVRLLDDGRPAAVDFHFAEPLDSPTYRFMYWRDGEYRPWTPPEPTGAARFPAEDFVKILLAEALR